MYLIYLIFVAHALSAAAFQINQINLFPFYFRFFREPQISQIGGIFSLALVIEIPKICGFIFFSMGALKGQDLHIAQGIALWYYASNRFIRPVRAKALI